MKAGILIAEQSAKAVERASMRIFGPVLPLLVAVLCASAASAAEKGIVLRAGDLKAQPFLDAANADKVTANQQVTITRRQGGWVQVEAGGKTGWLRMLNLRLEAAAAAPAAPATAAASTARPSRSSLSANPSSLLRTGSSGKTVTTGVKGLDEENIRGSHVDPVQVAALTALAVEPGEATSNAAASGLKETPVDYLQKGRRN